MNFLCLNYIFVLLCFCDAQYHLAKEENIDIKRILEDFAIITITYCLMKCMENPTCHFIGTDTYPRNHSFIHCYLIKEQPYTGIDIKESKRMHILQEVDKDTVVGCKSDQSGNDGKMYADLGVNFFPIDTEIKRNTLLTTISKITKEYTVQLEYKKTEMNIDRWCNVLHITIGGNNEAYGSRIASVFIRGSDQMVYICSPLQGNKNYCKTQTTPMQLNKWAMIKISQVKIGNDFVYQIEVDNIVFDAVVNTQPLEFHNVMVYVSNPWIPTCSGYIRNLIIK